MDTSTSKKVRQFYGQRKKDKGQTTIYKLKTLHRKLKIEQHEPHKKNKKKQNRNELRCSGRVNNCCSISGFHRFTLIWLSQINYITFNSFDYERT
jgi:hypothetical protein